MRLRRKKAAHRANDGTAKLKQHNEFTKAEACQQVTLFGEAFFEPDDKVVVRSIHSTDKLRTRTKSCVASNLVDLVPWMRSENADDQNIYIGINPRKRLGGGKTTDVALARVLVADWDDVSGVKEARARWEKVALPEPSLIVSSGHGIHAYWRLDKPIKDLVEWTRLQKALIEAVKSDHVVFDPPRIMRLPGFMNCKEARCPCVILS